MNTFKRPLKTMAVLSATGMLMLSVSMPANAAVCVDTDLLSLDLGTCHATSSPAPTSEPTPSSTEDTTAAAIAVPLPSPLPDTTVKLPAITATVGPVAPNPVSVVPLPSKPAPAPVPAAPVPGANQPQAGTGATTPIITVLPPAPKAGTAANAGSVPSTQDKDKPEPAVAAKPWSAPNTTAGQDTNGTEDEKASATGTVTQVKTPGQTTLAPSGFVTDPLASVEESLASEPARQSVLVAGGAVVVLLIGSFLFRRFGLPALA